MSVPGFDDARERLDAARERLGDARERVEEAVADVAVQVRPRLRGWIHLGAAPVAAIAGLVLVLLAPSGARLAAAVYASSVVALFTTSATYHRGRWSDAARARMRRLDHSMIYVLIAGTYTPFALLALEGTSRWGVLAAVWGGAAVGVGLKMLARHPHRVLSAVLYLLLGWAGVVVLPQLLDTTGTTAFVLVLVGGALYTVGALVYASQRPDPSPRWFGFHEVFHSLTVAAAGFQYVAVSMVTYRFAV